MNLRSQISDLRKDKLLNNRVHLCTGAMVHTGSLSTLHSLGRARDPEPVEGLPLSTIWKATIVLLIAAFQISCSDPPLSPSPSLPLQDTQAKPARIISLAPSITETLFALGLGDRVAGVTRYCDYPPEVMGTPVVGGYFDVNYEMLLSLEPELVIHMAEHEDARGRINDLGFETLAVDHSRVKGILESITIIAHRCGIPEKGADLRSELEVRIRAIKKDLIPASPRPRFSASDGFPPYSHTPIPPNPDQNRPRILVAVGRLMDKGKGGEIFISGRDGFYDDLISLAGGVNAYRDETLRFPAVSHEGLVRLDPDVIFEMVPDLADEADRGSLLDVWREKSDIKAVRDGRVFIMGEDYVVIPGPRFVDLLEDMAEIIGQFQIPESRFQTE